MTTIGRFPYPGAIDADGHILEPPDVWEKYLEPQYRDRAIRLRTNQDGLEVLELAGGPAKYIRPGQLGLFGAMGKRGKDLEPSPEKTYVNQAPFGAMDPKERLARMDQEGLKKAIIYPRGSGISGRGLSVAKWRQYRLKWTGYAAKPHGEHDFEAVDQRNPRVLLRISACDPLPRVHAT